MKVDDPLNVIPLSTAEKFVTFATSFLTAKSNYRIAGGLVDDGRTAKLKSANIYAKEANRAK